MKNINQLFKEYLKNKVNLDSKITKNAIECRENLLKNISEFDNEEGFFDLHSDFNINFGSFSRKTKCRELDDIDMMIGINANGAKYDSTDNWDNVKIIASKLNQAQIECTNEDGTLNSRKVLERFKSKLAKVREYSRSEIKRNYEAIVLNLKTKAWNFDIVPCFRTVVENDGRNYYLIPNGNGNWKKTDPRRDKNRISDVNQSHGGKVLNLIRLVKKWNLRNNNIKKIPSYMLETLIIYYFENKKNLNEQIEINFSEILGYIWQKISYKIEDMKNIQEDINILTEDEKQEISTRLFKEFKKTKEAVESNDIEKKVKIWKEVFGEDFPNYE